MAYDDQRWRMGTALDRRIIERFDVIAKVAAMAVFAIGAVVLLAGWTAGLDAAKRFWGDVPMAANTALCLVLCGASLMMLRRRGRARLSGRALAAAAGLVGLVTLVEHVAGWNAGLDELLFEAGNAAGSATPPGRMSPQTALAFVLTAAALLGLDWTPRGRWPSGVLAGVIGALAATVLLGHVYDARPLYALEPFPAMAAHTAAALLLMAVAISSARPDRGLTAILASDSPAGVTFRSLLPPALVVPPVIGTLVLFGRRQGFYNDSESTWLLVVTTVIACVTFAIATAKSLQSVDGRRRSAESRLADQGRRYRTLVEQLPLITYVDAIDDANTPLYVSPQVEATLGYSPDEWIVDAALYDRLLHPDDRDRVLSGIGRFRESGQPFGAEYRLRTKSGDYVWLHDETVQILDFFGRPLYAQGYMLDITGRKAAEDERLVLEAQLGEAQKLESIGQLAGGVAHDFRNMLGAIIAYAGFAQEKAQGDPELVADVAQIRRAAERGAELTQELLVFGRKDIVRTRVIDLNDAVTGATMLLRPLLGDRHALHASLDTSIACVEADPAQIQRVLMNLVMNARAAMPAGGAVEVRTEVVVLDEHSASIGLSPGEHVMLGVRDSGSGMSPEVAQRAFEPFFTTKPKSEGTGLGLSIVYGIAKRLGGHVHIESNPGDGTSVMLLLPAVEAEPAAAPPVREATRVEGHGEVVLVVDDDEALRRSTARILSAGGYAVLEATDGVDALDKYRGADQAPAVLVTDVAMPRMTGPQLADAVTAMDPGARVVFMSGYPEGLEEAREDAPLVAKPFTPDVLLTAVSEAISAAESNGG